MLVCFILFCVFPAKAIAMIIPPVFRDGEESGEGRISDQVCESQRIKAKNESSEDSVLRRVINLPQELIRMIVRHFSVKDLKTFRLLCLQYKDLDRLKFAVIDEMKKRCVLSIDLCRWDEEYVPHFL